MRLKQTSIDILTQINNLISQLSEKEYAGSVQLLMNQSIGKHVRHIIEFYDVMLTGIEAGCIDYDSRNHDAAFEVNRDLAIHKIMEMTAHIEELEADRLIDMKVCYSKDSDETVELRTSLKRELIYNIEHAVHHMAIIKIAIKQMFPHINLSEDFGIAYSTIKYQKACAQ